MSLTALGLEHIAQSLYHYDHLHEPVASPDALDESAVATFERDGFLAVENVFTPAEVESYKLALRELVNEGNPDVVTFEQGVDVSSMPFEQREKYVRKLWQFTAHNRVLESMSQHPMLIGIVKSLLHSDVQMIQDMALLKPAHVGREKPWHQDTAYFAITPPTGVLGTWTALDPATPENGCMHVIPGSHLKGCIPHYHDRDCQLADEDVDTAHDVCVPINPGGVLFFSGLIHHGTPPNQSAARRRAIQLHYASVNCRTIQDHEHAAMFADKLGYAGCRGWSGSLKVRPIVSKPRDF